MSGGGLPAIPKEEIERHWHEHEIMRLETMERIYQRSFQKEINSHKEALADVRSQTNKPVAEKR